jgi:hypothetical protein
MSVLGYIGDHKKDGLTARLGWGLVRLAQTGQRFGRVTHTEAVLMGPWWHCTIASATVRDGSMVRIKTTDLDPTHWIVLDVPAWDVVKSATWFEKHVGIPYSKLGASSSASMLVAIVIRLAGIAVAKLGQWCSRCIPESQGVQGAEELSPSEMMLLAWALPGTRDITQEFFSTANGASGAQ